MKNWDVSEREELYQNAFAVWGVNAQVDMLVEELAECIVALQKLFARDYSVKRMHDLASEFADVEIMMEEIKLFLDGRVTTAMRGLNSAESFSELVAEQVKYKLNRTEGRIKEAMA